MRFLIFILIILVLITLALLAILVIPSILNSHLYTYKDGGSDLKIRQPYVKFSDIDGEMDYQEFYEETRNKIPSLHRGQCKLFLNELQFLTNCLQTKDDKAIVIYAGACPSHHTWYLSTFFPNVKFVLVDPHICKLYVEKYMNTHLDSKWDDYIYLRTNIKKVPGQKLYKEDLQMDEYADIILNTDYKVYFIQDYFSIKLAKVLSHIHAHFHLKTDENGNENGEQLLFMCDIRTQIFSDKIMDGDIVWNLSQQYNWVHLLKPDHFMLKFRMPYYQDNSMSRLDEPEIQKLVSKDFELSKTLGIDFLKDYQEGITHYLEGDIYLQPWAKLFSTESRLVGHSLKNKLYMPFKEYESKFAYYNYQNAYGLFYNPNTNESLGFDNCGNCALESAIFEEYYRKYHPEYFRMDISDTNMSPEDFRMIVGDAIKKLADITGQPHLSKAHGHKFLET